MEELTKEQRQIFDTLRDPDAPQQVQYDFDKSVQQDILSLMIYERSFMVQAMHLVRSEYFADKAHVLLCKILMSWFDSHIKHVTGEDERWIQEKYIRDQLNEHLKENVAKSYYLAEFQTILECYVQGLTSRSYCLERVINFAKDQEIRLAISKTVDFVKSKDKEKYNKIKVLWDKALIVGPQLNLGLNYFEEIEDRYKRMVEDRTGKDRFSSGFADIDEGIVGHGLSRGEIGGWEAMSGVGKTWMLCKGAIENVRHGHRVLFVTLEMNQDKTAERFDTLFTGVNMKNLLENKDLVKRKINTELKMALTNLQDLIGDDKKRLIIKHFPAGVADMTLIRAYYSQLAIQGFKPDLLIVDYVGEFKDHPNMKTYESRQRLVRDLRAFGTEEDHCTFTALQSNRAGRFAQEGGFIDDSEVGDSYGQVRVMDAVWSINQTKKEKAAHVGRIFVVKCRNGKSRYHFCYYQDPEKLTIQSISEMDWKERVSAVKELKDDDKVAEAISVPDASSYDGTKHFVPNGE
jgi:KaiC/GvpD/RAD55 family RecA-like ATPase